MSSARDDVLNRIYVGQGFTFKAGGGPEQLVNALEPVLKRHPETLALLEFTSPGREKRQIDCALVGPGGIDVIEVKNHRGLIHMSADGVWTVQSGIRKEMIGNSKAGRSENPYDQAYNAAADLREGLKKELGRAMRVTPLVFLPSADARTKVVEHFNVSLALGPHNLSRALRSALRTQDEWKGVDYRRLPQNLGLTPMRLSFLVGWVAAEATHQGIEHLQVVAEVDGEQQVTTTDIGGYYSLCVRLGSSVRLGYAVPGQFETPPVIELKADQRILKVPDMHLGLRPPLKTEAEIRDELQQEMQERLEKQARQTQAAWNSAQVQAQLVLDDLTQQLYRLQVELNERERQLRQYQQGAAPLVARVLQQSQIMAIEEQRAEVAYTLERLKHSDNAQQQDTFRQSLALISRMTGELRQPLPTTAPAVVHVQAEARTDSAAAIGTQRPPDRVATQPERARKKKHPPQPERTREAQPPRPRTAAVIKRPAWVWPVTVGLLLVGSLGIWNMLRGLEEPAPASTTWVTKESAEAEEVQQDDEPQDAAEPAALSLPGEAFDPGQRAADQVNDAPPSDVDTQNNSALPGEPLR